MTNDFLFYHAKQNKKQNFHGSVDAFLVNTVDTTGAGDSFVGALLVKIVDDQSILEVNT